MAKAVETIETAETVTNQFAAAGDKVFKNSVEKSLAAFGEINVDSRKNLEAVVASMSAASKGAETLGARAMAYSKKSVEDQVAAAKTLAGAKSLQEALELQSAFARSAFEGYVAEVTKMTETMSASMKASLSPINARVTAMVERVQSLR
ncbi:MAG TPA: TIGR01841 family phasin [Caulobacteraceae bacterium]